MHFNLQTLSKTSHYHAIRLAKSIKVTFMALLFGSPLFMHGMRPAKNSLPAAIELTDFKERKYKAATESAQVELKKNTNQDDFVKTLTLFNNLPRNLQQYIHGFQKQPASTHMLTGHNDSIYRVTTFKDAEGWKAISTSRDSTLRIWNLTTGECIRTLIGHEGTVTNLKMYEDNGELRIISTATDDTLRVWSIQTGKLLYTIPHANAAEPYYLKSLYNKDLPLFHDDTGWKVATLVRNPHLEYSYYIHIWDLTSGKQIRKSSQSSWRFVDAIHIFQDSSTKTICSTSNGAGLQIWDSMTDQRSSIYIEGMHIHQICCMYQDDNGWNALCTILDQTGRRYRTTLGVINLKEGKHIYNLEGEHVYGLVFQDKIGKKVLSIAEGIERKNNMLRISDLATGKPLCVLTGHTDHISNLSLYQDDIGWKAVSTSEDKTIRIWDLKTGECLYVLKSDAPVLGAHPYKNGGSWNIVSAGGKMLRIWEYAAPGEAEIIQADQLAFHKDKKIIEQIAKNCGADTATALQRLIYEYAVPEETAISTKEQES